MNSTINGYNTLNSTASVSPLILFIGVVIAIVITLFFLFSRFRQFIIGAVVTGTGIGIYLLSTNVVNSHVNGTGTLWRVFWSVVGFIIISSLLGSGLMSLPFIKKLDNSFEEEKK